MLEVTSTFVSGGAKGYRGVFLARLGAVTQVVFAALLGIVASFGSEPGFLPRGVVLFVVFSMPGVVGWMGAQRRRPALNPPPVQQLRNITRSVPCPINVIHLD